MARPREDAGTARPLTLRVLGNIDHFRGSTLASMLECTGGRVTDRRGVPIAWLPRGETPPDEPCINRDVDADKRRLADHFFRVFGYPLGVEPDYYSGKIVQKSLRNGAHDGHVFTLPGILRVGCPSRCPMRLDLHRGRQPNSVSVDSRHRPSRLVAGGPATGNQILGGVSVVNMIAVTIGVGRCASLAIEAANRCRQFTGLDVAILNEVHKRRYRVSEPHHLKFHLFDILPHADRILYFDSDLWFVADWNPKLFSSLSAVRDNEFYEGTQRECERFGLPLDRYFNSGLFIIDRQQVGVLQTAKSLCEQQDVTSIWRDQTWLNLAAKQCGVSVNLIHRAHNTFPIPHDGEAPVIGAHGAGIDPSFADMIQAVSRLRRRGLPTSSPLANKLCQYTVRDVGSHKLHLRGDGTIGRGAAQLERYWYVANDKLVLSSWAEDSVHLREQRAGIWKGKWLEFGQHEVTLEVVA